MNTLSILTQHDIISKTKKYKHISTNYITWLKNNIKNHYYSNIILKKYIVEKQWKYHIEINGTNYSSLINNKILPTIINQEKLSYFNYKKYDVEEIKKEITVQIITNNKNLNKYLEQFNFDRLLLNGHFIVILHDENDSKLFYRIKYTNFDGYDKYEFCKEIFNIDGKPRFIKYPDYIIEKDTDEKYLIKWIFCCYYDDYKIVAKFVDDKFEIKYIYEYSSTIDRYDTVFDTKYEDLPKCKVKKIKKYLNELLILINKR